MAHEYQQGCNCGSERARTMLVFLRVALALALISPATPFAHSNLPVRSADKIHPLNRNTPHPTTRTTGLSISWPGRDSKNEAEGSRDTDSRLKLSGESSEASIFLNPAATRSFEEFIAPVSKVLDDQTGGWALSTASLKPEDETTTIGISFLATNIAYGIAGFVLASQGNVLLGGLTELACVASFAYHYTQLKFGQSKIVRLTLFVDYVFALTAIIVGSFQLLLSHQLPTEALTAGSLAIASLWACWIWEEGLTYIVLHSIWHLLSAYTGYIVGSTH